ncbi:hybrid sensor histidine kinase/response regulator [Ideonella sp.]|uniref:hybrid sensor histidine kinase/response regulator n=1 Tax=Ideonella sp. TaxID=1929293 RepID=UPI002B4A0D38|nr:ATP-binding protein [Ideonella sp.]HJV70495.1 ATP-binding protein [Ideonella sp.]
MNTARTVDSGDSAERTILLIEDNPADARLIREMLAAVPLDGPGYRLHWVQDLRAGIEVLRGSGAEIVLLDLGLPGSSGIDTVQDLLSQAPRTPTLIVLSGLSDEDVAVQALGAGAQDYLIKGQVDAASLARAIRYARGRAQADDALREAGHQIEAARQRAERASQAKSRFLATISHDLRTPLAGILGFAQLLQADPALTNAQRRSVDTIRHSGEHLLALIGDILDLAKIESGRFELCPHEFKLRDSARVVFDIIDVRARMKPALNLVAEIAPDVPAMICADERRLRQVLLNLLDNAVKFSAQGEVALRVTAPSPTRLAFEVADAGEPLSAAQIARLFHPFEQVGDAQHRSQGTGLGLAICRQLVRLMGGDIEAHSVAGHGNRFRFEIDLTPRPAEAAAPMLAAASTPSRAAEAAVG